MSNTSSPAVFKHKLVLINVNRTGKDPNIDLYDAVRYSWKLSPDRAEKADYVLAVIEGEIVGAFEPTDFGVLFCALLLWRYDEYAQDMTSYTTGWYSTVFSFGFSSLVCFMTGYLSWGWGLAK